MPVSRPAAGGLRAAPSHGVRLQAAPSSLAFHGRRLVRDSDEHINDAREVVALVQHAQHLLAVLAVPLLAARGGRA